jgi:hypothetical protein
MSGIDFSQYPVVDELIHECDMENEREHILWLQGTQSDAAVLLAEMHLLCKAALSDSIPLRNRSKVSANYYYGTANHKVHVFAAHQALSDLGMSEKDLSRLFSHKDVFGRR